MPQKTKTLLAIAGASAVFLTWQFVISPRVVPQVSCVIARPDGVLVKAQGPAYCLAHVTAGSRAH
jgi:hypothetical protein